MLFLNSVSFYLLLTPLFSPYQFLLSYLISCFTLRKNQTGTNTIAQTYMSIYEKEAKETTGLTRPWAHQEQAWSQPNGLHNGR